MFLRKAALRPVPRWAVVDDSALDALEDSLGQDDELLQGVLDAGFRGMDRQQPELAEFLSHEVSSRSDELAQSVGYFLAVTVYLAFKEAFPTRLESLDASALAIARGTLEVDEELRANDPREVFESDDVVAMGQPALVGFVQHHFEEALAQAEGSPDLDSFDGVYRAILVQVIALSHAVRAPGGREQAPLLG